MNIDSDEYSKYMNVLENYYKLKQEVKNIHHNKSIL